MKKNYQASIARANEAIRRNRQARKLAETGKNTSKDSIKFETLNCANAFARNGKNLEHLFDKLF